MQIKLKSNLHKKGYTSIFIIIFLSVTVLILFSIAEISKSQLIISKQYYESRKAYYIAESGIERGLFIIKNKVLDIIEKENTFDTLTIDKKLRGFIKREFTAAINEYSKKSPPIGADTLELTKDSGGVLSYYEISLTEDPDFKQRRITITSIGCYKHYQRVIIASYRVTDDYSSCYNNKCFLICTEWK